MLTQDVKQSIDDSVLCWLATVSQSGEPNCSPKEVFTYRGQNELLIANIASPNSIANIAENPQVCVSFVHVFKQKGFKLKGAATYIESGCEEYADLFALIKTMVGHFPVQGIIKIKVSHVSPIIAPSYYLVDGTTEASQIASAKRAYGVST